MLPGDHLLYSDESSGILKLSLESRSAAVPWHLAAERCASELDAWLRHWGERRLGDDPITAPNLRRLVVRTSASQRTMAALGRLDAPALETLELWNPDYAYGWDGKAADLAPLLNNQTGTPGLRHLALVTDVGDSLIDAIAGGSALSQRSAATGDQIYRCSPPATSILTGLLDGWHSGRWYPD